LSVLVTSPIMAAGTGSAYNTGFLVSMAILSLIAVPTLFLTETGRKKRRSEQNAVRL